MNTPISDLALNQLFTNAHTHHAWQDRPVAEETLRRLYDLLKWAPPGDQILFAISVTEIIQKFILAPRGSVMKKCVKSYKFSNLKEVM